MVAGLWTVLWKWLHISHTSQLRDIANVLHAYYNSIIILYYNDNDKKGLPFLPWLINKNCLHQLGRHLVWITIWSWSAIFNVALLFVEGVPFHFGFSKTQTGKKTWAIHTTLNSERNVKIVDRECVWERERESSNIIIVIIYLGTRIEAPLCATPHENLSIGAVSCLPVSLLSFPSPYTLICSKCFFSRRLIAFTTLS